MPGLPNPKGRKRPWSVKALEICSGQGRSRTFVSLGPCFERFEHSHLFRLLTTRLPWAMQISRDLPANRNRQRACYVQIRNAPYGVYMAFKRGIYPDCSVRIDAGLFRGRKLRMGSYGEPVAIPYSVWKLLVSRAQGNCALQTRNDFRTHLYVRLIAKERWSRMCWTQLPLENASLMGGNR